MRRLKRWSRMTLLCACIWSHAHVALAGDETGTIDVATARAFVDALTQAVESQGVRPREPSAYSSAKAQLVERLQPAPGSIDRRGLYAAARDLLATLDADGHTLLWSRQQVASFLASTQPSSKLAPDAARLLTTAKGTVLVLRPPAVTVQDMPAQSRYAASLAFQVNDVIARGLPCSVVVDLSDQTGGNAWPVIGVVGALATRANDSQLVDRDGKRRAVLTPSIYRATLRQLSGMPESLLTRFAGEPLAIVMRASTSSSGEMLAIGLRGEPKSRTFGTSTGGLSSSNVTIALPDGATLILTTSRYAFGDGAVIRGRLDPDVASPAGEAPQDAVIRAAEWAVSQTPSCIR